MSIASHLSEMQLSADQQKAVQKLEIFLEDKSQIFVLKGYAGSGKTTLLRGLIKHLIAIERPFSVMAPTGRAAKILRNKTGCGKTIHSSIYDFSTINVINSESNEPADHSFHLSFPIATNENFQHVIIVDEASMISSRKSTNELFSFGTDVLLNDLLSYAGLSVSHNKIIFVGDPVQLPPVGDNQSLALDENFFKELNLEVDSTEMTKVVRQNDNLILKNANEIRKVYSAELKNTLNFEYDFDTFCKVSPESFILKYLEENPVPEIGSGAIIAYSNAQCLSYNRSIRKRLFPNNSEVIGGDILCICNNNSHTYSSEIFNGDMAKVLKVSEETERLGAPVWVDEAGRKVKKNVNFEFRDVVLLLDSGETIECKILDSLLKSDSRDLSVLDLKGLYINFIMRFRDQQRERQLRGEVPHKVGSEEFKQLLRADKYINAVRVKYGYAITCHKAQGGEWDTAFIDYFGRVGLKDDQLRWTYTATTRGVRRAFVVNPPAFTAISKLEISEIIRVTNLPLNALQLKNVPLSPFHKENQHRCKSLKYWQISNSLKETTFQISKVISVSDFHEKYFISFGEVELIFESHHNKAGFFNDFNAVTRLGFEGDLLEILNNPKPYIFNIEYNPSSTELEILYSKMQAACIEINIIITNIDEKVGNYHVNYFLKTSGKFSYLQFYFDAARIFTRALVHSDIGSEDEKLLALIEKLK